MPCDKCNAGDEFKPETRVQFMAHVKSVNFDEFGNPGQGRVNMIKTWAFCSQECLDDWYTLPEGVFHEAHTKDVEADQDAIAPALHEDDLNLVMLAWKEQAGDKEAVDYVTFDTVQDLNDYWNEPGLPDKPTVDQAVVDSLPPMQADTEILGLADGNS